MDKETLTAYHEAGHASYCWLLGVPEQLKRITINQSGDKLGCVSMTNNQEWVDLEAAMSMCNILVAKACAARICFKSLLGECAEWHRRQEMRCKSTTADWFDGYQDLLNEDENYEDEDLGKAIAASQKLFPNMKSEQDRFIKDVALWTGDAVRHAQGWSVIQALATQLEIVKEMQGDDAIAIMRNVWGETKRSTPPIYDWGSEWQQRFSTVK